MSAFDGTSWLLVDGPDLVEGADVTMLLVDGVISGSAGCNRFHGRYDLQQETETNDGWRAGISVGALASTMKMCPPEVMALEREVLQRLGAAEFVEILDDKLVVGARGEMVLVFRAQTAHELTGMWEVLSIHWPARQAIISVATPASGTPLTVNIDSERVSGNGGCNTFNGRLHVDDSGSIRIGPLVSTLRMCTEPETMDQEQALFRALEAATGYLLAGQGLTLLRADGGISIDLCRA
jgi:heat shock protein HslJ